MSTLAFCAIVAGACLVAFFAGMVLQAMLTTSACGSAFEEGRRAERRDRQARIDRAEAAVAEHREAA